MVAKIIRGSSLYGALVYNQNKVTEDMARIISTNKILSAPTELAENSMQLMMLSFENYLLTNQNTTKPILHISLNPSPQDTLNDEQFSSLASDYMDQMGYGEQPYVVFIHEDTGRRHIHIVSTCVDVEGRKIDDKFEWKRSMKVCRDLEEKYGLVNSADPRLELAQPYLKKVDYRQEDLKHQVSNTLKSVVTTYKFQSFGEYSALLGCYNIEAKQVRGDHDGVPYTGIVYTVTDERGSAVSPPFKSSLFGKQFGQDGLEKKMKRNAASYKAKKWNPKIQDTVSLAMITCRGNREKFEQIMHGKGIDVRFRHTDEGRIYGVTFVDHNNREVYNGSRLGKEFSANSFENLFTTSQTHPLSQQEQQHSETELFDIDITSQLEQEPYDDLILRKKRRKKKKRTIS